MNNDYSEQKKEIMYDIVTGVQYVDAYCRYSSHMQDDGNSIEYQMEDIEKYCLKHGLVVRKWYIDKAKSAKKVAGRDAFYELIEDIKNGENAPNLIVWKTNRAFRNSYESHKYRKLLRENNIKFISVTQNIDEDTSAGRLTTNILSDIDQYKSEETAEQVTAALRLMVKRGFYTGQRIPLGYTTVPAMDGDKPRKKYAIDETTEHIVKKVFTDFVAGIPPYSIVDWLQANGVRTSSGMLMDYNAMSRMLKNDFYIGTRRYTAAGQDPLIIPYSVPAIIDEQTFDDVQHIFLSRRKSEPIKGRKSNRDRTYFLTGLAECEKCGGSYFGKTSGGVPYYMCKNRAKRKECDCMSIQKKHIEPFVFAAIREHILSPKAVEHIAELVLKDLEDNPMQITGNKNEHERRKNVLVNEIIELTQMKLDGKLNEAAFVMMTKAKDDEIAEIDMNIKILEHQQKTTVNQDFIEQYINDLFIKIESKDDALMKYVVEKTVERVIIGDSKVEIHLAIIFAKNTHSKALGLPNYKLCVASPRDIIVNRNKL